MTSTHEESQKHLKVKLLLNNWLHYQALPIQKAHLENQRMILKNWTQVVLWQATGTELNQIVTYLPRT